MNNQKSKHKIPSALSNKGITLIALIITIVVLLILAVVAIGAVQNDGIINHAKNARDEYEKAGVNENTTLEGYLSKIEEAMSVTKGEKVTGSNGIYIEKVGNKTLKAIIPVGFCVVNDNESENDYNTIESGLVISDVEGDDLLNTKKGNQFVWIPVEDYGKFKLIKGYSSGSLQSLDLSKEAGDTDVEGSPLLNNVKGTEESKAMYNSVKTNKGFYIARFEAGNPGTTITDGTVKPLSQKGVSVWNNIPWGGTRADKASDGLVGNDNADGAVKVARSMYTKSSECGVNSTLCYGVQWDAVMNYIDSNYYKQDGTLTSFVANSTGKGNYSGSLVSTGAYEQNHIFDLAGNVMEWTMEAFHTSDRVLCGGSYELDGSNYPASYRAFYCNPGNSYPYRRFPRSFVFVVLSAVKTKIK